MNIKLKSFVDFQAKMKTWVLESCPCRLCKTYIHKIDFKFSHDNSGILIYCQYSQTCLWRTPAVPKKSVRYNQVSAIESFGFFGQKTITEIKKEDFFSYDTSKHYK